VTDIAEALRTHILTIGGVSGLIGGRFYTDVPPQGAAMPALVLQLIDSVGNEHLQGSVGVAETRVQMEAWALTRLGANAIIDQLRRNSPNGLVGTRGTMTGVFVHGVSTEGGRRYDRNAPADASDKWRYITAQDFVVTHDEAT